MRRVVGLLRARLPELDLEEVADPRARKGRWSLAQILRATLVGLMAGCRSLWETEQLTETLSPASRRLLGLPRRLADTTARDSLCRLSLDALRAVLHRAVRAAWRRKALAPVGLPVNVVALDGKATALPTLNHPLVQNHVEGQVVPFGLVRTVTCSLVSADGRPCIDAIPIPAGTNEMGHFQAAFASLLETYRGLFDVVTYDAGALSEANASAVVDAGKDYVFRLRGEQRYMFKLAEELLDPADAVARTVDVLDNETTVTRTLTMLAVEPHWSYGDGRGPEETAWRHARTFLRVEYVRLRAGDVVDSEARMYVSSLAPDRLTPSQWLQLIRAHWGVENNNHHTFDTAFAEDDRPWIETDPDGMLAVLLLRRIAYTLLALFRAAARTDEGRALNQVARLFHPDLGVRVGDIVTIQVDSFKVGGVTPPSCVGLAPPGTPTELEDSVPHEFETEITQLLPPSDATPGGAVVLQVRTKSSDEIEPGAPALPPEWDACFQALVVALPVKGLLVTVDAGRFLLIGNQIGYAGRPQTGSEHVLRYKADPSEVGLPAFMYQDEDALAASCPLADWDGVWPLPPAEGGFLTCGGAGCDRDLCEQLVLARKVRRRYHLAEDCGTPPDATCASRYAGLTFPIVNGPALRFELYHETVAGALNTLFRGLVLPFSTGAGIVPLAVNAGGPTTQANFAITFDRSAPPIGDSYSGYRFYVSYPGDQVADVSPSLNPVASNTIR